MSRWVPRKGVAWRRVRDVGVIFNPWREIMIGLDPDGFACWERLLAGEPSPAEADADSGPALLGFFRAMGLFDEGDGEAVPEDPPSRPEHVLWTEAFQPLAFTASCALAPGQGDVCDSRVYSGGARGKRGAYPPPPPSGFRRQTR